MWSRSICRRLSAIRIYPRIKPLHRSFSTPREDRVRRITNWFPQRLRPFATRILAAPGANLTSFLIIHEITAVVPVFCLAYYFLRWGYMPSIPKSGYMREQFEKKATRLYERAKSEGYFNDETSESKDPGVRPSAASERSRRKMQMGTSIACAYAIVKVLAPVRIAASLWATPWFSRSIVTPVWFRVRRFVGR